MNTYKLIKFQNGAVLKVPSSWPDASADAVVGLDEDGYPVAAAGYRGDRWYFGLTMCCGASFKGVEDGIVCRACYREAEGNDMPYGTITLRVL